MAKITTITNPLTGQPAQVDQLEHTAQEIDDAIARALPGGDIDIALQNKAPGGYGYGENISFESWDDTDGSKFEAYLDNLDDGSPKIIRMQYISDYPALLVSGNGGYADVHFTGYGEILVNWHGYLSVLSGDDNGTSYLAVKKRTRGEGWSPWEYVNPPMLLGVEYRTTERYLGKPVYVKVIQAGFNPAGTNKTTSDTTVSASGLVRFSAENSGFAFPTLMLGGNYNDNGNVQISVHAQANGIYVTTFSVSRDMTSATVNVSVYYTKD